MKHEKLSKILGKKRSISDSEKEAKMHVLGALKDMASQEMGGKLKKVSVMSDSDEGLKSGLDKARDILSDQEENHMRQDSERPYSDAMHAHQEHEGEEGYKDWPESAEMWKGGMSGYEEGGEIQDSPDKGEYDSVEPYDDNDQEEEETPDKGDYEAVDQGKPAEEGTAPELGGHEEEDEFHGLDMDEIHSKLQKLMALKKKMESRKK